MEDFNKYYCDTCNDFNKVVIKTKESKYSFLKSDKINIIEDYAVCEKCGLEVYHEDTANLTLNKVYEGYKKLKKYQLNYGVFEDDDYKEIGTLILGSIDEIYKYLEDKGNRNILSKCDWFRLYDNTSEVLILEDDSRDISIFLDKFYEKVS